MVSMEGTDRQVNVCPGRKGYPCFKLDRDTRDSCMGGEKARDHPEISQETRTFLRQIYRPMLEDFNNKTGMNIRLS